MKLDILLSAMHLEHASDIDHLHITGNCILVNQCDREGIVKLPNKDGSVLTMVNTVERGLSKSRNLAIGLSDAELCKISDNDVVYVDQYENIIVNSFLEHQDADVIVFFVKRKERMIPLFDKPTYMNYLTTLKACSVEIAFRRERVKNIHFHETFGAGSGKYLMGEENIFLYDCLKNGRKILYLPIQIAELADEESTWNTGFHEKFFLSRGANYHAMSHRWSHILIWQYAVRKIPEYQGQMSTLQALRYMYKGRLEHKKSAVFVVGEQCSETAPAKITRQLVEHFPSDTLSQKRTNKILRLFELYIKLPKAGKIICSGFSKQNLICFRYAKKHAKTSFYLMHGCAEFENQINGCVDETMVKAEQDMLSLVDYIVAVSEPYAEWLKIRYPQHKDKILVATNGIDWESIEKTLQNNKQREAVANSKIRINNRILTSGGGLPIKNILPICEAIDLIYQKARFENTKDISLPELVVIGPEGINSAEIKKFPFVSYLGSLSQKEVYEQMTMAKLYIQDSLLETFGLAPVEAIVCGCELLLSKEVGAINVIQNLSDLNSENMINDNMDVNEISEKIVKLMTETSEKKVFEKKNLVQYNTSIVKRALQLYELIQLK